MVYQRVQQQTAYILHKRPYRDTSLLLTIFSEDYGRLNVVAKGGRTLRRQQPLELFIPFSLSWSGRGELMTLIAAEAQIMAVDLTGTSLLCALYINELLVRLLPPQDAYVVVFAEYKKVLHALADDKERESNLRYFEQALLSQLGYGLALDVEAVTGKPIVATQYYQFTAHVGLLPIELLRYSQRSVVNAFSGSSLLAFHHHRLTTKQECDDAKRLVRLALAPLLGDKPLKSRSLFMLPQVRINEEALA